MIFETAIIRLGLLFGSDYDIWNTIFEIFGSGYYFARAIWYSEIIQWNQTCFQNVMARARKSYSDMQWNIWLRKLFGSETKIINAVKMIMQNDTHWFHCWTIMPYNLHRIIIFHWLGN